MLHERKFFLSYLFLFVIFSSILNRPLFASQEKINAIQISLLLDWKPNTNHTGFYVAKEKNFYTQNGLDLKILNPAQTTTTSLVGSGRADFGITYANDLIYARNQGIPVVVIAGIIQADDTSCFVWRKTAHIDGVKSFEGKRYGGWGSPEEAATLKYVMEKNGADFSKVKMLTTGSTDFLVATKKDVDFTWEYKAWGILNAQINHVDVKTYCPSEHFPVLSKPSPLLITNENMIRNHPDVVKKFLRATEHGYQIAIHDPKTAAKLLLKEVPELDQNLVQQSAEILAPLYQGKAKSWGYLDKKKFENYAQWMRDVGLIQQVPKVDDYLRQL